MILEEETFRKFGYYPCDLKPHSCKRVIAQCDNCGKIRETSKNQYRALCHSCAMKRNKGESNPNWGGGKTEMKCQLCGKMFYVDPNVKRRGGGKFCSRGCKSKGQREGLKGQNNPFWNGGKVERVCQVCGGIFYVTPSQVKRGGGKFCSYKCIGKWRSENKSGVNSSNWNGGEVKCVCKVCGASFSVERNLIARGRGKVCSIACRCKWASEHNKGENNPNWRGGISFEPYCEKFDMVFKEHIRDRFNRECFLCGKSEEENKRRLSVHHVDYDKTCLCDTSYSCQFVPLCIVCHAKTNTNREYWQHLIQSRLKPRLDECPI